MKHKNRIGLMGLVIVSTILFYIPASEAQFSVGSTVSQAQLNSINVNQITHVQLRCAYVEAEIGLENFYVYYTCLDIRELYPGMYRIIEQEFQTATPIVDIERCLSRYTQTQCRNGLRRDVIRQTVDTIDEIKNRIIRFQEQPSPNRNIILEWLRNLGLFG